MATQSMVAASAWHSHADFYGSGWRASESSVTYGTKGKDHGHPGAVRLSGCDLATSESAFAGVASLLQEPQYWRLTFLPMPRAARQLPRLQRDHGAHQGNHPGSGVLVKRDGDRYTVLTASHG